MSAEKNTLDMIAVNYVNYSARDALYAIIEVANFQDVIDALIDYYHPEDEDTNTYVVEAKKSNILISDNRILVINK